MELGLQYPNVTRDLRFSSLPRSDDVVMKGQDNDLSCIVNNTSALPKFDIYLTKRKNKLITLLRFVS